MHYIIFSTLYQRYIIFSCINKLCGILKILLRNIKLQWLKIRINLSLKGFQSRLNSCEDNDLSISFLELDKQINLKILAKHEKYLNNIFFIRKNKNTKVEHLNCT